MVRPRTPTIVVVIENGFVRCRVVNGKCFRLFLSVSMNQVPTNSAVPSLKDDANAGWVKWSLSDWNAVLLRKVFFDKERLGFPITRINASDHFLAKCAEASEFERDDVKRAFIKAFGNTEEKIRRHFSVTSEVLAFSKSDGEPNFFAMLYLTLLVASADDMTHDIGNFRMRLPALLLPVVMESPNLQHLPKFWERLRQWSIKRACARNDCRVIELPNHGREKIIGISKRLAFPGFRDERILAKLMSDASVGGRSEYHQVDRAVSGRLSQFSANFKAEFDIFHKFLAKADFLNAFESDFWNAVRDISWEIRKEVAESAGVFQLGLECDDPAFPTLYLLADAIGVSSLASSGNASPFIDGLFLVSPILNSEWKLGELAQIADTAKPLQRSSIWKCLQLGCIAFFPDAHGRLTTEGTYSEGYHSYFALKETIAKAFFERARDYNVKYTVISSSRMADGWKLVSIGPVSAQSMSRMLESLPEAARNALGFGWRPPRPSWTGGAWFGQALLLSPASVPIVKMNGAVGGEYVITTRMGRDRIGMLEEVDDGFSIPTADLLSLNSLTNLTVRLDLGPQKVPVELSVPLIDKAPFGIAGGLKDVSNWLCDGPGGTLSPAFWGNGKDVQKFGQTARLKRPSWPVPQLAGSNVLGWGNGAELDLDDIPQPLDWLCEALSLRFQCRTTPLSFSDLARHTEPTSVAAGTKRWRLTRLLTTSAWICSVERRASSHRSAVAAERTIALHHRDSSTVVRIVGMFTHAERAHIKAFLQAGETVHRIGARMGMAVGAIEVQLVEPARIFAYALKFNLTILSLDEFAPPLAPSVCLPTPLPSSGRELASSEGLERWDFAARDWIPFERDGAPVPAGNIVRVAGFQKNAYWIFGSGWHWKTESEVWAFLLLLGATRTPVGVIAVNGDCKFNPMLRGVPQALARWWLHWGGGCIELASDGSIVFSGGSGVEIWKCFVGWNGPPEKLVPGVDIALRRRRTALRSRSRDIQSRASSS